MTLRRLVLTLALAMMPVSAASAWEQTLSCDDEGVRSPVRCDGRFDPVPIQWETSCVHLYVNERGSRRFDDRDTPTEAIMGAAEAWNEVDCARMQVFVAGLTDEERIGFRNCGPSDSNANVVVFQDGGWRHGSAVVALTSVTYDLRTGRIHDADIEVNTQDHDFSARSASETRALAFDLQNVMTHEIGHLLGFDHTTPSNIHVGEPQEARQTTMYFETRPGELAKRTLHPNDADGLCAVYPGRDGTDAACAPSSDGFYRAPSSGPSDACPSERGLGCAVTQGPARGALPVSFVLLSMLIIRRSSAPCT